MDVFKRDHPFRMPTGSAEGHEFNKAHFHREAEGHPAELKNFFFRDSFEGHNIDLCLQSHGQCLLNSFPNLFKLRRICEA
jgi:hypothetical protein